MARPLRFDMAIELPATAEVVWDWLTDWERLPEWMTELSRVRVLGPGRGGVGMEAEGMVRIAGITTRDCMRITAWEPPNRLEIAHLGWVKGGGLMLCSPRGAGTRLAWSEWFEPPLGLLGQVGMLLLSPLIRRRFEEDLRRLQALLSRQASPG